MGRLLRLMLSALGRALRALGDRLHPAPVHAVAAEPADEAGGGPPTHWLAMVRQRAPGLHVSLQERGVVARARSGPARPAPPAPPTPIVRRSAGDRPTSHDPSSDSTRIMVPGQPADPAAHARRGPASSAPIARATVRSDAIEAPMATHVGAPIAGAPAIRLAPDRGDEPAARALPPTPGAAPAPGVQSDAHVIAGRIWRQRIDQDGARPAPSRPADDAGDDRRLPLSRPFLPRDPSREPAPPVIGRWSREASPLPAQAHDEDAAPELPVGITIHQREPRWSAPTTPLAGSLSEHDASGHFPSLPDEPQLRAPAWSNSVDAMRTDAGPARWPGMTAARTYAPAMVDRWPELHADDLAANDHGLPSPLGHRARLEREQRGILWNG